MKWHECKHSSRQFWCMFVQSLRQPNEKWVSIVEIQFQTSVRRVLCSKGSAMDGFSSSSHSTCCVRIALKWVRGMAPNFLKMSFFCEPKLIAKHMDGLIMVSVFLQFLPKQMLFFCLNVLENINQMKQFDHAPAHLHFEKRHKPWRIAKQNDVGLGEKKKSTSCCRNPRREKALHSKWN